MTIDYLSLSHVLYRTKKNRKATILNMNSKYQSKFPEKSILKLKEKGARELSEAANFNEYPYMSGQPNRKGFSIPADIQLTLKPDVPEGVKPSLCFCKPPAKRKCSNENINQRDDLGLNSEIRSKEPPQVEENVRNGTVSQQHYTQFYMDILFKESSRASVIQYASCLSGNQQKVDVQINGNKQLNGNQILVTDKQINTKESEEQSTFKQTYSDARTENKQVGNRLTGDEQGDCKEISQTQQDHDEQWEIGWKDGKIQEHISQLKVPDGIQLGRRESQDQRHPAKHSSLCGVCLQKFSSILSLEKHQKESGHYLCSECGESLPDDAAFRMHSEEKLCKKAVCTFCGQKFITRDELENHKAVVHHKCLECNKLYNSAGKHSSFGSCGLFTSTEQICYPGEGKVLISKKITGLTQYFMSRLFWMRLEGAASQKRKVRRASSCPLNSWKN